MLLCVHLEEEFSTSVADFVSSSCFPLPEAVHLVFFSGLFIGSAVAVGFEDIEHYV